MSLRPPAEYWIRVTTTGGAGSSDPTNFTLGTGDTKVPITIGGLHLQGILFETSGGTFSSTPVTLPAGASAPANVAQTVPGAGFYEQIPQSINGSATTAVPFVLYYGGLGPQGR